jgi:hypothetical protein
MSLLCDRRVAKHGDRPRLGDLARSYNQRKPTRGDHRIANPIESSCYQQANRERVDPGARFNFSIKSLTRPTTANSASFSVIHSVRLSGVEKTIARNTFSPQFLGLFKVAISYPHEFLLCRGITR